MNVLIFVMSMLMLLVMITFGRLESFRSHSFVQVKFKEYMKHSERDYINESAMKRYRDTVATRSEKKEKEQRENSKASSKLSFNIFVDKKERDGNPQKLAVHLNTAHYLIDFLYRDQEFYQKLEALRPNFVSEMLSALIVQSESLPKINHVKELATIDLKDPELNDAFTHMLAGAYVEPPKGEDKRPIKLRDGYYSLQDFITVKENKLELRVFLASRQLLMVVYGNPSLVNEIIRVRYQLYKSVVNNVMTADQAREEFRNTFGNEALPFVSQGFLNFDVSKTNPNLYR